MSAQQEYQFEYQEYHDITCEPVQPQICSQCPDEELVRRCHEFFSHSDMRALRACVHSQGQIYCSTTGFKQEMRCSAGPHINGSEQESYITFQSCAEHASSFSGLVRFEVRKHWNHTQRAEDLS